MLHISRCFSARNPYTPRISRVSEKILEIFLYLCSQSGKDYCWPSQEKIIEILDQVHQISISRRTLNYHLRALEDHGFIRRIRRIKRGKNGQIEFHSTLYCLLDKARKLLKKLMRFIYRSMKKFAHLWKEVVLEPRIEAFGSQEFASQEELNKAGLALLKEVTGVA